MKEPLVFVILLVWNGYEDTIECIHSLEKISYSNYKILIVDNGSTNSAASILRHTFPQYTILENKKNLGFSAGCNVGIKHALKNNANYVLLLNNDTIVDKNFLNQLVHCSESNTDIGIVSPFIYYADKPKTIWASTLSLNLKSGWPFVDKYRSQLDNGQFTSIIPAELLTGCCVLIKRNVFDKVGLFREEYFLYFEDMDFTLRAKHKNIRMYTVPQSKIWHKVGSSSSKKGTANVRYYFVRNFILFYKYNSLITYSSVKNLVSYVLHEVGTYIKAKDINALRLIARGVIDGLVNKTGGLS